MGYVFKAVLEVKTMGNQDYEVAYVVDLGKNEGLMQWLGENAQKANLVSLFARRFASNAYLINTCGLPIKDMTEDIEDLFEEMQEELNEGNLARVLILVS